MDDADQTMNLASDQLIAQRQLRAAEIALETARRRKQETEQEIWTLRTGVQRAEAALAEMAAARAADAREFAERLDAARLAENDAAQRLLAERNRRRRLDEQITVLRREAGRRDDVSRQLAAETRIRQLEGELELVIRRASEFEYGVRMAAFDAFKLVRTMTGMVNSVLARTPLPELPALPSRVAPRDPAQMATYDGVPSVPRAARPVDPTMKAPSVASVLDSQRLDAALDRLRASTPPPEDLEP